MSNPFLNTEIVAQASSLVTPNYGMTVAGYTKLSGAPTRHLVQLQGEKRFRRVMAWCFSNSGSYFVRVKGVALIIPAHEILS